MNRDDIEQMKARIFPILEEAGVVHSAIFGSLAKGEANKKSDIDILVEFQGEKTLLDLAALKYRLEKVLDKRVDLVTYKSLSPFLRDRILKEQMPLL